MPNLNTDDTSETLMLRLRHHPEDGDAWDELSQRYRPRIYQYCLSWQLQPSDAEDVTQNVFLKLSSKLRTFEYDRNQSFRAWLRTVTRNALADYHDERRRAHHGSGDSEVLKLLQNVEAREGLAQQLEAEFDQELLEVAIRRVKQVTPQQRWDVFQLTTLEGVPATEVAARLGMLIATVYTAKSKVQKQIRHEIARLEAALASD